MPLQQDIQAQMREAMKAKDELRLSTLRGLLSAFTNELVAKSRKPTEKLDDEDALAVIKRQVKQRDDSIEQYMKAGRTELAEKERAERDVLAAYLPEMMGREEIEAVAKRKRDELGALDKTHAGRLMGAVMAELKGKADGKDVKAVVENLLE